MSVFDEIINKTFIVNTSNTSVEKAYNGVLWTMNFTGDSSRYTMTVTEMCGAIENVVVCTYRESIDSTRLYLDGPNLQTYKPYTWMITKPNAVAYDLWVCTRDGTMSFRMIEESKMF